jgi:predicted nuclease of restriction endonuclease-like (RecB) superfamily
MSENLIKTSEYRAFIQEIKQRIQAAQIKAAIAVNQELLHLYWDLAKQIVMKQQEAAWGDGFLLQMSQDLKAEFPDMKGFSKRNLELMRQWYRFWSERPAIAQQLVSQIPWGHNLAIVSKIKSIDEAVFYVQKTILKTEQDNPTIGILICKSKKDTVVEYALRDINKPIGVSECMITQFLPDDLKSSLPSIEEIEVELGG